VRRRSFLTSVAAVSPAVVAGCARPVSSGDEAKRTPPKIDRQTPTSRLVPSLPVTEVKSVAAAGVESAPESVADLAAFERALRERALTVERLTEHDTFLSLKRSVDSFGEAGIARSAGVVAGVYAAYVSETGGPSSLSVTVTHEASTIGTYAVARAWATEYLADETTKKEYAEKVLGTVETKS
jgi:hypothetical protein